MINDIKNKNKKDLALYAKPWIMTPDTLQTKLFKQNKSNVAFSEQKPNWNM